MFIVLVRPPAAPLAAGESQRRAIGPPAAGSESAPGSHTLPSRQQSQYTKKTANRNNEHSSSAGLTGHPSNPPILQQTVTVTPEKLVQHLTSCMFTTEKIKKQPIFFHPPFWFSAYWIFYEPFFHRNAPNSRTRRLVESTFLLACDVRIVSLFFRFLLWFINAETLVNEDQFRTERRHRHVR